MRTQLSAQKWREHESYLAQARELSDEYCKLRDDTLEKLESIKGRAKRARKKAEDAANEARRAEGR